MTFSRYAPHRLLPLANVLLKRVGLERTFAQAADEIEILQEEEREEIAPAIALPGEHERATAADPLSTLERQLQRATQDVITHAPVIRYTFRDCVVGRTGLEFFRGSLRKRALSRADLITGPLQETGRAFFPMRPVSHQFFGHLVTDACTMSLLAGDDEDLLLDIRPDWPHAQAYCKAFSLDPAPARERFVRRLALCQDFGQGSLKRTRYRELQRRLVDTLGDRGEPLQDVYLRRGRTGASRMIVDEDALTDRLVARGFKVLDIGGASLDEMAAGLANARRVVSMEGSHAYHFHYLAPQGADLFLLIPSDRFTLIHRGLSAAFGRRFGYTVICPEGDGYRVDPDRLFRTLELFD